MSTMNASSNSMADDTQALAQHISFGMVPLGALSVLPGLFDESLCSAVQMVDQFVPIIVWRQGDVFWIIDGNKRYQNLLKNNALTCACGTITIPFNDVHAGLLHIQLNSHRALPWREKYLFLYWLKHHLDESGYIRESGRIVLTPGERHDMEHLFDCSEQQKMAVFSGTLDCAIAPEMDHLTEQDTHAILQLFRSIGFSRQMQRELVEWLPEIAFNRKISTAALLETEVFKGIMDQEKLNGPQKAARFHEEAHTLRFPLFSKSKKLWQQLARTVNPNSSKISFQPSNFFEKQGLELRIKISRADEVHPLFTGLLAIEDTDWQRLVDPTRML